MASANPHNAYLPGYDSVNHHELRTAESSAAYLLPVLQQKAKSKPTLTLLDVGAGPGTITAGLAAYMPEGRVTGTDISPDILARAAANATRLGIGNVSFQPADVYALPFEDGAFDVVHAHQMLLYLDSPVAALREMLRVAAPAGGVVAVRNNDMGMWSWWPRLPGLQRFHEVQLATHEAAGGTNLGGVRLISWALEAGVEREKVVASMGTWSYSDALERRIWGTSFAHRARAGALHKKALEMGIATADELEEMAKAWEQWMEAEDGWFGCMHGEVLIYK